jgi:hypothetical protein
MKSVLKNRFTTAVCTVALTLGAFSCQKALLEPVPVTYLLPAQAFDTPSRVLAQVNGLYSYVKTGGFLGGRYQIFSDIRASDFINRTSNSVTGLSVWNHTESETSQNDVINTWSFGYAAINEVNIFLASLDANAGKLSAAPFPTGYAATATNYRAEARLLRALCYYSLLQLYARPYIEGANKPGLPLRLTAETQLSSNNDLARSTVGQVYDQIILDLNFAEQNLPLTYTASQNGVSTSTLNVTRAHRNTAIALKTRVYLTMGRYDDVIREANKIVSATAPFAASSGVNHTLASTVAAVFAAPQETTESILSFPFTAQDTPGTQNQLAYYYLPTSLGGNGEYSLNSSATGILNNPGWLSTDNRRTNFVAPVTTTSATGTRTTEYFLAKYPTGTPYTDKAPVIRYAEVLLNLAEARVRSTNTIDAQALALLNAVRGRSNPAIAATATIPAIPIATYAAADFTSVTTLLNAMLLERRIEFLGEGIRNMDLMRLDATIPGKGSVGAVEPTNVLYVWPIPATELATNLLMTRN